MQMDEKICETPITGHYVAQHLRASLGPHAILKSFQARKTAIGQGYISHILHFTLEWEPSEQDHLPNTVIVKVPTMESMNKLMDTFTLNGEDQAAMMKAILAKTVVNFHNTECDVYRLFKSGAPTAMPKCFVALSITDEAPGLLVLEDLSAIAATSPSLISGLTYNQIVSAIEEIARLHVWSLQTSVDWRSSIPTLESREEMHKGFFLEIEAGLKVTKEQYPNEFGSIDVEKLISMCGNYDFFLEVMTEHRQFMDDALVHSDYHMNNILYEKHADGTVGDKVVAIIDFQVATQIHKYADIGFQVGPCPHNRVRCLGVTIAQLVCNAHRKGLPALTGSPIYDISRLFTMSISHRMRQQHFDTILHKYYDELKSRLGDKIKATYEEVERVCQRLFAMETIWFSASIPTLKYIMIKSEGEQREKDEKELLERFKVNFEDACAILGI